MILGPRTVTSSQVSSWFGSSALSIPSRGKPGYILYDDFNRTTTTNAIGNSPGGNISPEYLWQSWSTNGQDLVGVGSEGMIAWDVSMSTYFAEFTISNAPAPHDSFFMVRTIDRLNTLGIYLFSGNVYAVRRSGGNYSQPYLYGTTTWATGDVCGIAVTPTTIDVYKNDVKFGGTWSTTDFASATKIGVRVNSNSESLKVASIGVKYL